MDNKKKRRLTRILWLAGILLVVVLLVMLTFFLLVYAGAFGHMPTKQELLGIRNEEASLVYSSDDKLIGKFFAQNRTNIRREEVPEYLRNALVATEDKRFYSHKGIDVRGYVRVLFRTVLQGDRGSGGGSTITQQLVKNLHGRKDYGMLSIIVNKTREGIIAYRLEKVYSKEDILLLYLNSVPFGEDVYGIESAARRYFNKGTAKLNIQESAVLIGMLKANTSYNPRLHLEESKERRNVVLGLMATQGYITSPEADSLKELPVSINYESLLQQAPAGYFVHQVKGRVLEILQTLNKEDGSAYDIEKDGLRIYTTLNLSMQQMAQKAIAKQLALMQPRLDRQLQASGFRKQWYSSRRKVWEGAGTPDEKQTTVLFEWSGDKTRDISVLDSLWHYYRMLNAATFAIRPENGEVLVWVGGNSFKYLPYDLVLARRQIASAFKPVLYASALESGFVPCDYLDNEVKTYADYEDWSPGNFERTSTPDSSVALWYALVHSMNLPTLELYFKNGGAALAASCQKLLLPVPSIDAPSVALGSQDISLLEIVRAYAAFANQGVIQHVVMINRITDADGRELYVRSAAEGEKAISGKSAEILSVMLQEAINQGTGSRIRNQYNINAELAGKTGTASEFTDAWFIAYTPALAIGSWVGCRTPEVHFSNANGTGSALALPIVAQILAGMEKSSSLRKEFLVPFAIPDSVNDLMLCDPYREKGLEGLLDRFFKNKKKSNKEAAKKNQRKARNDKKKKTKVGRFLKDLFGN